MDFRLPRHALFCCQIRKGKTVATCGAERFKPLKFKRDFDFKPIRVNRLRKNRGFANIARAQVQHDAAGLRRLGRGLLVARDLTAARSAHRHGRAQGDAPSKPRPSWFLRLAHVSLAVYPA
ncbi:hypothetical protein HNR60_000247 [Rhodopseudomonas rhenobacensis]|uniref:Uncharacterized protein n=1 Tax=Rhodopseudomonas rhenobacensis TaxID=87461 RepID=A0A7W7Z026_9BRAD|nr:hypothetical protein [Rhodopseudomonas rhenobacensis]